MQTVSVFSSGIREGVHDDGEYWPAAVTGGEHASHIFHDSDSWLELPQYAHVFQIERLSLVVRRIVKGITDISRSSGQGIGLARGSS